MPKGKKFDAAEQHFLKKKQELDKVVKKANETARLAVEHAATLKCENDALKAENERLKAEHELLLKRCEMTPEDLKRALNTEKHMATLLAVTKLSNYGG